jgi:hypothetical protein
VNGVALRERGGEVVGDMRRLAVILGAIAMIAIGAVVFVVLPSGDDAAVAPSNRLNALGGVGTDYGYGLVMNGASVGPATPLSPGTPYADVIETQTATGVTKAPSRPRYEPLVVEVGLNGASALSSWISQSFLDKAPSPITLGLANFGVNGLPPSQVEYLGATIVAIESKGCDRAADGPTPVRLRLSIAYTSSRPAASVPAKFSVTKPEADVAQCRLSLPKIDASAVRRIELPTMSRDFTEVRDAKGQLVSYAFGSAKYANFEVELNDSASPTWNAWFNELVMMGDPAAERSGTLGFFASDAVKELGRLSLERCGIVEILPDFEVGAEHLDASAVLYCEATKYTAL